MQAWAGSPELTCCLQVKVKLRREVGGKLQWRLDSEGPLENSHIRSD